MCNYRLGLGIGLGICLGMGFSYCAQQPKTGRVDLPKRQASQAGLALFKRQASYWLRKSKKGQQQQMEKYTEAAGLGTGLGVDLGIDLGLGLGVGFGIC